MAAHRLILEPGLFPQRRPGRWLLEVLQKGTFAAPEFRPQRPRDGGRDIEL
jgi:hypothetical protein